MPPSSPPRPRFPLGPQPSLASSTLYHLPLGRVFAHAAAAGFGGVELVMTPGVWVHRPAAIARMAARAGLALFSVHPTALGVCPGGRGERAVLLDALQMATALGAPRMVIHAPLLARDRGPGHPAWEALVLELAQRAAGKLTLALENQGTYAGGDPEAYLGRLGDLVAFAERHDLGLTLDTCHLGTAAHRLLDALALVRPRLHNVHLSDVDLTHPTPRLSSLFPLLNQHLRPGSGRLPLRPFLRDLAAGGYRGPVTLELSPAASGVHWPPALRRHLAEGAAFIRRHARPLPPVCPDPADGQY